MKNDLKEMRKEFKSHFEKDGIKFDDFIDPLNSMLFGEYKLNVIKFDDWLHENKGYDEDNHGSMADFINQEYGSDATKFIRSIL